MKRLTERLNDHVLLIKDTTVGYNSAFKKLAEYEDMHETGRMINVDPVINKLQKRIDDFLKLHPERKGCEEVVVVEEFIHTLEIEADEQNKDK